VEDRLRRDCLLRRTFCAAIPEFGIDVLHPPLDPVYGSLITNTPIGVPSSSSNTAHLELSESSSSPLP